MTPDEHKDLYGKREPSQDDTTDKEIKSKYTTIHEALEAAKNTKTVRYKVKGARMICDTCEYKDYSTDELPCSRCTPDSRSYREAKREPSQDDKQAVKELISGIRTINKAKQHEMNIEEDDEPCYWQRREWIVWILDLANKAEQEINRS